MKGLGSLLFFLGLISTLITFADRELVVLSWIGNWGEGPAWAIRIGLMVAGAALWLVGRKPQDRLPG